MELSTLNALADGLKDSTWKLFTPPDAGLAQTNAHMALQRFVDALLIALQEQQKRIAALEARPGNPPPAAS